MPDAWNAAIYLERAMRWRAAAEELPLGEQRDSCLALADQYAKLAKLIEKSNTGYDGG
jgi:hypothetical protein